MPTYTITANTAATLLNINTASFTVNDVNHTQNFTATSANGTLYEDGSDASDWVIYDTDPVGATVTSVNDSDQTDNQVIFLQGTTPGTEYYLTEAKGGNNGNGFYLELNNLHQIFSMGNKK